MPRELIKVNPLIDYLNIKRELSSLFMFLNYYTVWIIFNLGSRFEFRSLDVAERAIGAFRTILESCGFENVRILKAFPPQHVLSWARGDDIEMTDEEVAETIPYFKVYTGDGSFGIIQGAYLLIDSKDTGVNALDLGEDDADEDFYFASLNVESLRHLKRLLRKLTKEPSEVH